jgi:RNA polymerase sigma-70 factor (ECF subfamily)
MRRRRNAGMSEPDCDNPKDREAEIRRLIQKRDFEGALQLTIQVFGGEIKSWFIGILQRYVDDPISEAEYLTQILFFEFYNMIQEYDPSRAGIRTILYKIAKMRLIDRLRERSRDTRRYELVSFEFEHSKPYSPNPEEQVLNQNFLEHVREELAKEFTPLVSAILLLHYFEGMTVTEIAHKLDKSANNISKRLSLARPKFEELMVKLKKEIDGDK